MIQHYHNQTRFESTETIPALDMVISEDKENFYTESLSDIKSPNISPNSIFKMFLLSLPLRDIPTSKIPPALLSKLPIMLHATFSNIRHRTQDTYLQIIYQLQTLKYLPLTDAKSIVLDYLYGNDHSKPIHAITPPTTIRGHMIKYMQSANDTMATHSTEDENIDAFSAAQSY